LARLERIQPTVLAFNGKKAGEVVLARKVEFGPRPERLAEQDAVVGEHAEMSYDLALPLVVHAPGGWGGMLS
jgi:hypothetical protein